MADPVRTPRTPALLGITGLIAPAAAVAARVTLPAGTLADLAWVLGLFYAALIFSFLGGTWWGFAARRRAFALFVLAVAPSLFALVTLALTLFVSTRQAGALLLGVAILISPLCDAIFWRLGLTPRWWMRLRVPLSVGLAALTITLAVMTPMGA